jgi:SET domain-containing protein
MKQRLLDELINNTYVILRPSSVAGIGVFAIKDIAQGCRDMFSAPHKDDQWIKITRKEVELLPQHTQHLIENYCLYDEDHYFVPDHGFKKVDLSLFLNHSDCPNVVSIQEGEYFEAIRPIKEGEELFINYGDLVADE